MRNFRQSSSNRFSRDRGDRSDRRPSMHDAVCDKCGRDCQVPFMPTGNKPIYCSNCFEQQSDRSFGNRDSGRDFGRDSGRFNREERRMFSAICDECGDKCELPFKPTGDKPVFCSRCFDKTGGSRNEGRSDRRSSSNADNGQLQAQIDVINGKLDRILQALEPSVKKEKKAVEVKQEVKKPVEKKTVKKATKVKKAKKKEVVVKE